MHNDKKKQETPYIVFSYGVSPLDLHQKRLSSGLCKSGIDKIACGSSHFLLLTENSVLLLGGNNIYGQCAREPQISPDGENLSQNLKVAQLRLEKHLVIDIAAGSYHSLVLTKFEKSNSLMAFGHELGCGFLDRVHRHNPTGIVSPEVPEDDPVTRVYAGRMRSAVILRSGKIKMWGEWYNGAKQRALRAVDLDREEEDRIIKISMGQFHALFLSGSGKVYSWGDNTYGELGADKSEKWRAEPLVIEEFRNKKCVDCEAGGRHSLVLEENGNLYSFGDNSEGQCGIEMNRSYRPHLVETRGMLGEDHVLPKFIYAGDAHSALVTSEGDLFAWGDNSEQRLGIHTSSSISRPTLVEDVMGRNLCAVGLGGFFSIFITGPRDHAIGNKDLGEQKKNKFFKNLLFTHADITAAANMKTPVNKTPVNANGEGKPEDTGNKSKKFSFAAILGGSKTEETKVEERSESVEKKPVGLFGGLIKKPVEENKSEEKSTEKKSLGSFGGLFKKSADSKTSEETGL